MSSAAVKEFLKTPKGKLIAALGVLVLTWIIILFCFVGSLDISLPSESRKKQIKQEIRKLRAELQLKEEAQKQNDLRKKRWKELANSSWRPERDGDPALILRQKIETLAKKSGLTLNNLGTVRINRINQDFCFAELDVSTSAPLESIVKFIRLTEEQKPVIYWKRLNLNAIVRRNRFNNKSRTITGSGSDNNLIFSGNVRVMVYDADADKENKVKETPSESAGTSSNNPQPGRPPFGNGPMPPPPPPGGEMPR